MAALLTRLTGLSIWTPIIRVRHAIVVIVHIGQPSWSSNPSRSSASFRHSSVSSWTPSPSASFTSPFSGSVGAGSGLFQLNPGRLRLHSTVARQSVQSRHRYLTVPLRRTVRVTLIGLALRRRVVTLFDAPSTTSSSAGVLASSAPVSIRPLVSCRSVRLGGLF